MSHSFIRAIKKVKGNQNNQNSCMAVGDLGTKLDVCPLPDLFAEQLKPSREAPEDGAKKVFSIYCCSNTRRRNTRVTKSPFSSKGTKEQQTLHEVAPNMRYFMPQLTIFQHSRSDSTRRRNLKKDKRKSWINIFSQKVFLITSIKMWFFFGGKCYCCERRRRPRGAREQSTKWKFLFVCSYEGAGRVYWERHWWFLWIDKGLDWFFDLCQCTQSGEACKVLFDIALKNIRIPRKDGGGDL